jgi:hypothetical protein
MVVALLQHVPRRGEPLLDGGRHAPLDDDGQSGAARRPQQRRVVHGARADHQGVDMGDQLGHVIDVERLGNDGQPGDPARLVEQGEPLSPHALERLGRCPRLVHAAAQHRGAGLRRGASVADVPGLHGAGAADDRHCRAADENGADGDRVCARVPGRTGEQ